MSRFIDRRLNGKNKSAVNRQRFIRRFRQQLKEAVDNTVKKRKITDIEQRESITIPAKDVKEYQFRHGAGGVSRKVFPGNKEFIPGDKIPKPESSSGGTGSKASDKGEGVDDFIFELSSEEFLDIFFDDLELPDLIKKQLSTIKTFKKVKAGYTSVGSPTNINIIRSMKGALARKIALGSPYRAEIKKLEQELEKLTPESIEAKKILAEIETLKLKLKNIPFIDTYDLRYNNKISQPVPSTHAVMFCAMDVSGSMDKTKKDIAKRFFILLFLFLKRNYETVDIVFIRHHTTAKEVDEKEFFYSRETGGTVVSSALKMISNIITKRYDPANWNIYVAQASDGDNWNADSPVCKKILETEIIPKVQYCAYVEIMPRLHQSLWEMYSEVKEKNKNFAMKTIGDYNDIYPVFRELFKRQST